MRDGSDFRNQMWATGRRQLDVAHALAAHLGQRDLDAALLADQALVLHALVLAAQALVVLDRPEDARAEQAVALRLEGAVVDGLRLLDLAERPGGNIVRAGDRDADLIERRGLNLLLEEVGDLVHRLSLLWLDDPLVQANAILKPRRARPPPLREAAGSCGNHSAASCGSAGRSSGAGSSGGGTTSEFTSSTLRPRARISLTSTLKLSGIPASKASSPRTMAS